MSSGSRSAAGTAPGAGLGRGGLGGAAGEASPPEALAGCRARALEPAARLLSRAPRVGSGREAGPRVLAPRAGAAAGGAGEEGGAANRRGGPVRAPRRLSAGWDRSAACDSATPRPRAPRPARAGKPPSPVGSRPVCRGAAHRSPRVVARRWHPNPTSEPGLGARANEGPGGRWAPGACWGSRPGLEEEEDRSEGRSASPPAPWGLGREGRGGGDAKAPRGRPSVPWESSSPFLTRRRRPEAPGPILEAKGQERRLNGPSGWSAKIRALALEKNKQTKIQSPAGGCGTRINPVGWLRRRTCPLEAMQPPGSSRLS